MRRIMRQLQFLNRRVPTLYVLDTMKELGVLTQCTRDCSQPANMLGMTPAGVVATAIAV
jgi:hypothetical protein